MKIYVVNYKETTIDDNNVMGVESGVCDYGYFTESEAIKKCCELSDDTMNEFVGELDMDNTNTYHENNDNNDWQYVYHNGDTYEYWVSEIIVDENR